MFQQNIPPSLFQLIPSHIKLNACSFTDENVSRVFDDHRSCQKLINYITNIKAISKRYYWIQKLPVLWRLFIQNCCKRSRCLEANPVFLFLSRKQIMKKKNSPQVCKWSFRLSTVPNLKSKIKRIILIFFVMW